MLKLILLFAVVGISLGAPSNFVFGPVSTNRTLGIVGGTPADISQFPWQVSLHSGGYFSCAGALIAPTWVLTAGHCVGSFPVNMTIRAGSNETESGGVTAQVESHIRHPNYNSITTDSDVALLKLTAAVNHVNASAAQLPPDNQEVEAGASLTVTGWGDTDEEDGYPSAYLLQTTVPVVSRQQCNDAYSNTITNTMFCAGLLGQGGKDACQGDSGGPAVVNNQLVGIVSWGNGCASPNYPGVYAQVSVFRAWIRQNTGI